MYGIVNEQANLAYAAQRQADLETAARHSRLIRTLKEARRERQHRSSAPLPCAAPLCRAELT